ncbi:MAG: hypothetical protein LBO69_05080 [Ignavibacteria bacterium]|jgi:hypothetical protein|nr:hypothetical protein [Ignavibacteria bacterium]
MKKIGNISSIEGRILLQEIFHKLRFERQRSGISTLFILWRICTSGIEIKQYFNEDITIIHKIGLLRGTAVWFEEIVNRFYFSTINSFVYFGAAVLLVIIGVNRFSDKVDNSFVIFGIAFEATMLLFMFIVMLFSPNEDVNTLINEEDSEDDMAKELLDEVGEISRDFAVTSTQLDKITDHLLAIVDRQNELSDIFLQISKTFADVVNPNPQMINTMNATNALLKEFQQNIIELNNTTRQLKQEELQILVRNEVERFLTNRISKME